MKISFSGIMCFLIVVLLSLGCTAKKSDGEVGIRQTDCNPDTFVLQAYEAKLTAKPATYIPDREKVLKIEEVKKMNDRLAFRAAIYPKEAGSLAITGSDRTDMPITVKAKVKPSGARVEMDFSIPGKDGIDLSEFRNGTIEFSIKGPANADAKYMLEAGGGMYVYGQTAAQSLLLNGEWQKIELALHHFDRMIAPGARYVVPLDYSNITAPLKLSLFLEKDAQIEIGDILLKNRPPEASTADQAISIYFDQVHQDWDGFGVNYVESSRSRDFRKDPEDYSGFSLLSEEKRKEIIDLVFGEDGLQPAIVKMFLDPLHESTGDEAVTTANLADAFDHETTTRHMRYFAKEGLALTRKQGRDLTVLTGLYGPPAWATEQKFVRGRDLDTTRYKDLAVYMASWIKFLRQKEGLPVQYISIHNEGDSPNRWDEAGKTAGKPSHDHNAFWRPWQVADFVKVLSQTLIDYGLSDVGITPGEYNTWQKFYNPGYRHHYYARSLYEDEESLEAIDLITSHSFWNPIDHGINLLRSKKPELHAWTTSMAWNWGSRADVSYLDFIRREIYDVKVNGLINWAISYAPNKWVGNYPDPGTGIFIEKGKFRVEPAYYYYKQLTRAGRPGAKVATAISSVPKVDVIAFSGRANNSADAFIVYNLDRESRSVAIRISGTSHDYFEGFMNKPCNYYIPIGRKNLRDGRMEINLEPYSSIVFFGS